MALGAAPRLIPAILTTCRTLQPCHMAFQDPRVRRVKRGQFFAWAGGFSEMELPRPVPLSGKSCFLFFEADHHGLLSQNPGLGPPMGRRGNCLRLGHSCDPAFLVVLIGPPWPTRTHAPRPTLSFFFVPPTQPWKQSPAILMCPPRTPMLRGNWKGQAPGPPGPPSERPGNTVTKPALRGEKKSSGPREKIWGRCPPTAPGHRAAQAL